MMMQGVRIFLLCLACAGTLHAADKPGEGRSSQPIQIKSNELLADNTSRTATFIGKVVARQGDITIYCDRLVIFNSEKQKEVEKVEAFGNVRIVQGNRIGQAKHALYENGTGRITLDGDPKVFQGDDVITGKTIVYLINEQKSIVTGSADSRVEAVIHPKSKVKDGAAKP